MQSRMASPNDSHTPPGDTHPDRPRARRVRVLILAAVGLFVLTQALLYYRWATMREPTGVLIVEAAKPLRGAEIEVSGQWLTEPYKVIVGSGERFSLPFYLDPGRYQVRITQHGQTLAARTVEITHEAPGIRLDLSELEPAPATAPAGGPGSTTDLR
jgi:hypothetical protein